MSFSFYTLVFTVPVSDKEKVLNAIFTAGAGNFGNYDHAYTEIRSQGHFRPLQGAKPFVGNVNVEETVDEVRIELVVPKQAVRQVTDALLKAHPYETPSYYFLPALTQSDVISPKGDKIGTFVTLGFIVLLFLLFFSFFTTAPAENTFVARLRDKIAEKFSAPSSGPENGNINSK